MTYPSDLEIANAANKKHIDEIANLLEINNEDLIRFGDDKAKISSKLIDSLSKKDDGKLILVTAISPTPAGEGKTTTSVGLVDGLCNIGKNAMICLREPSLGPCFGMKGGAAGGGGGRRGPCGRRDTARGRGGTAAAASSGPSRRWTPSFSRRGRRRARAASWAGAKGASARGPPGCA